MQQSNHDVEPVKIYLAAPLFSDAERTFNAKVANDLEVYGQVYLPQRDGGLMEKMTRMGISSNEAARLVFQRDVTAIREANCLIAILDGRAIDEGVAFELGVAFSCDKCCVGLQTDPRRLAPWGNNPMITGALKHIFNTVDALLNWSRDEFKNRAGGETYGVFIAQRRRAPRSGRGISETA